ncbi:MAG: hypothetical protein CMO55_28885 [Verrucomicrobiales bacterium]|nr:hypothetical protein [Verrucomicrobiales bacterium]
MEDKTENIEKEIEERGHIAPEKESMIDHMPEYAGQKQILHSADKDDEESTYHSKTSLREMERAEERDS